MESMTHSKPTCRFRHQSKLQSKIVVYEHPSGGPFDEELENFDSTGGGGVLISCGSITWHNGARYRTISGGCFILLNKGMFTGLKFSKDFEGYLYWMSEEFIDSLNIDFSKSELFYNLTTGPHIQSLNSTDMEAMSSFFKILAISIDDVGSNRQIDIVKMLVKALIYKTVTNMDEIETDDVIMNHKDHITKNFLLLSRKYGHQHRELSFYADKMCITTKYLSSAIAKSSGRHAHIWLEQVTMNKAKYLLKETDKPIYLIADELNFGSPADFVRYFRSRENATPLVYRRKSQN